MRKFALALLAFSLLASGAAHAQIWTVYQLQTSPPPTSPLTLVNPIDLVVTAVRSTGFFVSQAPHGAWNGIWVYYPGHGRTVGDFVNVCGIYKEVCGLTTIDVPAAGALYGYVLPRGTAAVPAPVFVTAADLLASPEQWESVSIMITDGMAVPAGFSLGSGMWNVDAFGGSGLVFGDFWYPFANVMEGQCYNNATGILHDNCGQFVFEPFADGIDVVSCSVDTESVTMGGVKALFR